MNKVKMFHSLSDIPTALSAYSECKMNTFYLITIIDACQKRLALYILQGSFSSYLQAKCLLNNNFVEIYSRLYLFLAFLELF